MPEGTPPAPGDEPERPASRPTEPLGGGWPQGPTEPLGGWPPGPPGEPGPPGPPGAYGPGPGYGYPQPPRVEPTATAALLTAIIGFFLCFPVAGVVGLILALNAERRVKESGGRLTGLDQARIAKVIAIIELALVVLGVLLAALLIAFANPSGTAPS